MAGNVRVIPTKNFERNLDTISDYLTEQPQLFDALLDRLFDEVIPNLEAFPMIGRDFLERMPDSLEALRLHQQISESAVDRTIREYLFDQYLILYALGGQQLHLLAIKHHRQLSFDLSGSS